MECGAKSAGHMANLQIAYLLHTLKAARFGSYSVKQVIRFIIGLLMPIILIASGGVTTGWGIENDWDYVAWAGVAFVVAGIIWGLVIWLWVDWHSW